MTNDYYCEPVLTVGELRLQLSKLESDMEVWIKHPEGPRTPARTAVVEIRKNETVRCVIR